MKKYRKGNSIDSFLELMSQDLIWVHGKVLHRGFWQSWQYTYIIHLLKQNQIFKAEKIKEK